MIGSGEATAGRVVGRFEAVTADGGATNLTAHLDDGGLHPWGIYDQDRCGPPAENHDAPFQFADIETGEKTEQVETAAYLAFPTNLVLLVFGADGGTLLACLDLGPPTQAGPSPTAEDCPTGAPIPPPGTPVPHAPELALSRDQLGNADIYVMPAAGGKATRLTTAVGIDIDPSWSPDGRLIAFRTVRDGQDEIYLMNADGSCQRNLTNDPGDDRSPAWSPDGRTIALDHFFGGSLQDIALIDVAGGSLRRVTRGSGEYAAWSPDGRRLAFASARDGDYEIFVTDVDGSNERQLTFNGGYDMYPAWSPDGAWIAYESSAGSSALEIHVMHPDGTGDRRLTTDDVEDRFPAWGPDGQLVWSHAGTLLFAAEPFALPDAAPVPIGTGQFPAWRP